MNARLERPLPHGRHPARAIVRACAALLAASCASTSTIAEHHVAGHLAGAAPAARPPVPFKVQVVRLGLAPEVVRDWPDLRDKRLGFGLSNRIVEALYDSGWFRFLEEREAVVERIVDQWDKAINRDDLYRPKHFEGLEVPDFLVYGEIFEFSTGREEHVTGLRGESHGTTRLGLQLRFASVATGEFIPASAVGEALSDEDVRTLFSHSKADFAESAIGQATQSALDQAVPQLLKRIERSGLEPSP